MSGRNRKLTLKKDFVWAAIDRTVRIQSIEAYFDPDGNLQNAFIEVKTATTGDEDSENFRLSLATLLGTQS